MAVRFQILLLLFCAGCGPSAPTTIYAVVTYRLVGTNDACILVSAAPAAADGLTATTSVPLKEKSFEGELAVAVMLTQAWSGDVGATAVLRRPSCGGNVQLSEYRLAMSEGGKVPQIQFTLDEAK